MRQRATGIAPLLVSVVAAGLSAGSSVTSAQAADPERISITINSKVPGTELMIGLTPVGPAPVQLSLDPGTYHVTATEGSRIIRRKIAVGPGKRTAHRMDPDAWPKIPCGPHPSWLTEGSGRYRLPGEEDAGYALRGVGTATWIASPLLAAQVAQIRAAVSINHVVDQLPEHLSRKYGTGAKSETRQGANISSTAFRELNNIRFTREFVCPDGTAFALGEISDQEARLTFHRGIGAGDIVAHGLSGAEVESSAWVAAFVEAIGRMAIERRAVELKTELSVRSTDDGEKTEAFNKATARESFEKGDAQISVVVELQERLRGHAKGKKAQETQHVQLTTELSYRGMGTKGSVRSIGGLLEAPPYSPFELRTQLSKIAEGLGLQIRSRPTKSVLGVPTMKVELRAPRESVDDD